MSSNLSNLISQLTSAVVLNESNFDQNKKLWNAYANDWSPSSDWLQKMASNIRDDGVSSISCLGEEWSDEAALQQVLDEFLFCHVSSDSQCLEIGVGGGRLARRVAPLVAKLTAVDIASAMLDKAREATSACNNVEFHLLESTRLDMLKENNFDFIYCFDVLVHCDMHVLYQYLVEIQRVLKPNGRVFLSTADITSKLGFERFKGQKKQTPAGFCWTCPSAVRKLFDETGFVVEKETPHVEPPQRNVYYERDYLVILKRK